jgi:DNA-binding winged helix-turn-helix (wHTH) protein/Tol biopolymer transport system component
VLVATAPDLQSGRIFSFGPFELSERAAELRKNGARVKLQEQPYQILIELVANAGEVVTREDLQQKLWPADTFVDFDVGLNSAVRKLRHALGDDADHPRYIETLAKRGYRFIAPVVVLGVNARSDQNPAPGASVPVPEPHILIDPGAPTGKRTQLIVAALSALVLAVLGVLALRFSGSATPHLINEQRVTSNPEEAPVTGAVVSPDGKYVAYSDSTGIYFRQLENGETHPLPLPTGQDWVPTSWYPDSTHLLLSARSGGLVFGPERLSPGATADVWRISILGGAPQRVVEAATAGVVSPDGSHVAFFRGGGGYAPRQLWIADNEGSDPNQILVPGAEHTFISQVTWSPHGKRLAYLRMERSDRELWAIETLDLKTRATRTIAIGGRFAPALCWGPDGRLFYGFQVENVSSGPLLRSTAEERFNSALFFQRVNEDTGAAEGPASQLTQGSGFLAAMSISANGKRLVLWRDNATPEAFVTEFDSAKQKLLPLRRLTLDQNANMVTTWTPDSSSIIFTSNRSGPYRLYRQPIDQSVPELVVSNDRIILARLAPDGRHLVCMLDTDAKHEAPLAVVLVPLEGGPLRTLFRDPALSDIQCARSPSSLCLISTVGPVAKVSALNLEDGSTRDFPIPKLESYHEWSLSPDGSTLALIIDGPKLVFMNIADKKVREIKLSTAWSQLIAIDWAPDSKSVYIPSRKPNGDYVLLRVESNGTAHTILEGSKVPRFVWGIPAPDGKHIAVQASSGENNVWMVDF